MGLAYAGASRAGAQGQASAVSRVSPGSIKEAAGAPNGAAGAAAERSGNQPHASAANQLQVPVVQAESVPNREPGCCKRLLEYIGYGNAENPPRSFSVNANASFNIKLN